MLLLLLCGAACSSTTKIEQRDEVGSDGAPALPRELTTDERAQLEQEIESQASRLPFGMRARPELWGQALPEGGVLEREFTAVSDHCYAVVSAGGYDVRGITLDLVARNQLQTILATDSAVDGAIIGEPDCYWWQAGFDAQLLARLRVTAGQGPVAMRLYEL